MEQVQITSPGIGGKADTPRFLIPLDIGIGDTILVGLSAVDQIIQNDATAYGKIDILCNPLVYATQHITLLLPLTLPRKPSRFQNVNHSNYPAAG